MKALIKLPGCSQFNKHGKRGLYCLLAGLARIDFHRNVLLTVGYTMLIQGETSGIPVECIAPEALLMSTSNMCFHGEIIRKILSGYPSYLEVWNCIVFFLTKLFVISWYTCGIPKGYSDGILFPVNDQLVYLWNSKRIFQWNIISSKISRWHTSSNFQ